MKNQSGTIKTNLELDRVVMGGSGGYRRLRGGSDHFSWQTDMHHNIYIKIIITGASEPANEEHDKHADSEPRGCRPPLHPRLRSLHRQRLCPHVLAIWPFLVPTSPSSPYYFLTIEFVWDAFACLLKHMDIMITVRCRSVQYIIYVTAYVSIYTLVLMALDRFLAVVCPVSSITIRSQKNVPAQSHSENPPSL